MAGITFHIDSNPLEIIEELKEQQRYKHMWKNKYNELEKEQTQWTGLMEYTKTLTGCPSNTEDLIHYIKEIQEFVEDGVVEFMKSNLFTQLNKVREENEKLKEENKQMKGVLPLTWLHSDDPTIEKLQKENEKLKEQLNIANKKE